MPALKSITLAALGALAIGQTQAADVWVQISTWTDSQCQVQALDYTTININQLMRASPSTSAFANSVTDCKTLTTLLGSASSLVPDPATAQKVQMLASILDNAGKCVLGMDGVGYTASTCGNTQPTGPATGSPFLVNNVYSDSKCSTPVGSMAVVADKTCRNENFAALGLSYDQYQCASVSCNSTGNSILAYYPDGPPDVSATGAHYAAQPTESASLGSSKLVAGANNTDYATFGASSSCQATDNMVVNGIFGVVYNKYSCNTSGAAGNGFSLISSVASTTFSAVDNTPQVLPGGASLSFKGANGASVQVTSSPNPRTGVPIPKGSINSYWQVTTAAASGFSAAFSIKLTSEQLQQFGYSLSDLKWAYNNDTNAEWVVEKSTTIDKSTGQISVNVSHFSTWTVVSAKSSVAKMLPSLGLALASIGTAVFFGF